MVLALSILIGSGTCQVFCRSPELMLWLPRCAPRWLTGARRALFRRRLPRYWWIVALTTATAAVIAVITTLVLALPDEQSHDSSLPNAPIPEVGVEGVTVGLDGAVYIANDNSQVWKADTSGRNSILAGTGTKGFSGDGGPATNAQLNTPHAVAIGADGTVYIADTGNNRVRKVDTAGRISTLGR
jgi:DNA-binding beta-propeller fold protein YncE